MQMNIELSELPGDAVAFLVIGAAIALFVAAQFGRGVTYGQNPPVKFERKSDPFGFWLQMTALTALAVFLLIAGLIGLLHTSSP